jgi:hypothetical protein
MRRSSSETLHRPRGVLALGAAVALATSTLAWALTVLGTPSPAAAAAGKRAARAIDTTSLLRSRLLWATIDVCDPVDQPDTVGIRGSMPGDHSSHDTMYMRFRLQYMDAATKAWTDLSKASASYTAVGSGASARQAGRSFKLNPVAGQPAFTLRGVVNFEWRHGSKVLARVSRASSAGRQSLAGSDPPGFSAATCLIG